MRFESSDPDIETLTRRIEKNLIDLQPDFQRGEVWTQSKKQRLVDSVFRGWHIPPIHLVRKPDGNWDVLDGQQRLTAIRDFLRGEFPVSGSIEPRVAEIESLDGLRWGNLPESVKEDFNSFTIRVFTLTDFAAEEPYELFFRLNQPTNLTEAEKRNAFIGSPRNQVKQLVDWAMECGMRKETVGFTNARMAYDDVIARFVLTLETRQLNAKITSVKITERYRKGTDFSPQIISQARNALNLVMKILEDKDPKLTLRPNKATLHTWLCMAGKIESLQNTENISEKIIDNFRATVLYVESRRAFKSYRVKQNGVVRKVMDVFDNRATSRVMDVSSVILRDLIAWMVMDALEGNSEIPDEIAYLCGSAWEIADNPDGSMEADLTEFANACKWGGEGWI